MVRQEPAKLLSPVQIWVSPFFIITNNIKELSMAKVISAKSIFGISNLPVAQPFLVSSDKPLYTPPVRVALKTLEDKFVGKIKK